MEIRQRNRLSLCAQGVQSSGKDSDDALRQRIVLDNDSSVGIRGLTRKRGFYEGHLAGERDNAGNRREGDDIKRVHHRSDVLSHPRIERKHQLKSDFRAAEIPPQS